MEKEWTEWVEERRKGLAEVENLKKQAEELSKELPALEEGSGAKLDADMKVDEDGGAPAAVQAPAVNIAMATGDPVE